MQNKIQLFCFTYSGGSAAFFEVLADDLDNIDVIAPDYAGHGARFKEPFYRNFDELSEDLFEIFRKSYRGGDYALFGYSMGCISAVEVLKRILSQDMPAPKRVFLAAHEPHSKSELVGFSPDELDEWVMERTISFGAIPEKLKKNKSFWRMYLPIFRADYSLIGEYQFESLDLITNIPLTVFFSEKDTPFEEMKLWEKYFQGACEYYEFEGSHFFMKEHHKEIASIIAESLSAVP